MTHYPPEPSPSKLPPMRLSDRGRDELHRLLSALDRLDQLMHLPVGVPTDASVPFGRFQVRHRLGAGRFGVVFAADDSSLNRSVALKVPQPFVITDPNLSNRFLREAQAVARIEHPGVVPVLDTGEIDGLPYLIAGLVAGPSLAEWMSTRGRPLESQQAAQLLQLISEAVQTAHDQAVLHCDLKPANVLLDSARLGEAGVPGIGVPRITDFGLARILVEETTLTQSHIVAGTPSYMAPEQASGDRRGLTGRADIYALGAILYELLTGAPPDRTDGLPLRFPALVPPDLQAVTLRCLELLPADRYATAAALADDLRRFQAGLPTTARPLGPIKQAWRFARRNTGYTSLVAAIFAVAFAVPLVAIWYSGQLEVEHEARLRAEADAERDRASAQAADFATTLERIRQRRIAADAGWTTANHADLRRIAVTPLAEQFLPDLRTEVILAHTAVDLEAPRLLAPGFKAYAPAYRPDGRIIALGGWLPDLTGTCRVELYDPITGHLKQTLTYKTDRDWEKRYGKANIDGCRSLVFSPDGRWLVLGTRSGWLIRWDMSTANPEPLRWRHAPIHDDPKDDRIIRLAFGPTGRILVASSGWRTAGWELDTPPSEVFVVSAPRVPSNILRPARLGDPLYAATDEALFSIHDNPPTLSRVAPLTSRSATTSFRQDYGFLVQNSGYLLVPFALATGHVLIPFTQRDTDRSEDGRVSDSAISPEGTHLVTTSEHLGHLKIWDTTTGRLLADRTLGDGSLRLDLSPDGTALAVCVAAGTHLFDWPSSSLASPQAIQAYPYADASRTINDEWVTYAPDPGEDFARIRLWLSASQFRELKAANGIEIELPGNNNDQLVALSPDGQWIAYSTIHLVRVVSRNADSLPVAEIACSNLKEIRFDAENRLWLIDNQGVRIWSPESGTQLLSAAADWHYQSLAKSQNVALAGRSDGRVELLKPSKRSIPCFGTAVTALALSADEKHFLAGSIDGRVCIRNVESGALIVELPTAHRHAVRTAAFGPSGWFVTGSRDRTVQVWDVTGRKLFTIPQTRPVRRVFISPDGQSITTLAEGERALKRWHLPAISTILQSMNLDLPIP
jgi:eukaryotic-like serine/threonine-protein kinase